MMSEQKTSYDLDAIRAALPLAEVCGREGVAFRRAGGNLVGCCPFHEERSGSFTIHARNPESAHCYGCGWNGDLFDFWVSRRGGDFKGAVADLAGLAGLAPLAAGVGFRRKAAPPVGAGGKGAARRVRPSLPHLVPLAGEKLEQLAEMRGLSVAGLRVARGMGRLMWCDWPMFEGRDGRWRAADDAAASWVVTDGDRWVAQFRRLDGAAYVLRRRDEEAREIRMWTKGSPVWPLGAGELAGRAAVLLVEGGADMLAAYHFLHGLGRLGEVAVVAMLGASNRIAAEALPLFRGKRVRIMMDADEVKGASGKRAGYEAAARWQCQLSRAGAAVEVFSLAGLVTAAGKAVKDLNDLALCSAEVVGSAEVLEAFFDFDF